MPPRPNCPLDLLVRKLELHTTLEASDSDAILSLPYKLKTLEAHCYTVREGERPSSCAVLVSGFAFRHKVTGNGSRQIVSLHIPGEPLDFQNLFLSESDHNVQMLTRGEVADMPIRAVEKLMLARPKVSEAVMIHILVESSIFREWTVNVGRRDARSRIAHVLCEFVFRLSAMGLNRTCVYELPLTQEQLADVTGLTSVHVNRVLKALQAEGLIHRDRRMISFPDFERLREVGDFNPRYLHAKQPALLLT